MTKKRQHRKRKSPKKTMYRVRNWSAYNQSLVQRGSITLWINERVLDEWHPKVEGRRRRGGQLRYSDQAIECLLMVKALFGLPYRQTVGFGQSLMALLAVDVQVPDYTTLCKRSADLSVDLSRQECAQARHIVVDSTGLKVYGEGEWKVRQHGYSKRRTWRKLHLSVDDRTHEIQAVVLTEASVDDAQVGNQLVDETPGEIEQVSGDGAYDKAKFYKACVARQIHHITVPPRRDAKIWQHGNSAKAPLPRDQNLRRIRRVGRQRWKEESGYYRRSLAETAMFRFKTIFGRTLRTRTLHRQRVEARIKCALLNRMSHLGMPDSYPAA